MTAYAELVAATAFSFLDGASQPADMVVHAAALGHAGIGMADRNRVAGVVRAHRALGKMRSGQLGASPTQTSASSPGGLAGRDDAARRTRPAAAR